MSHNPEKTEYLLSFEGTPYIVEIYAQLAPLPEGQSKMLLQYKVLAGFKKKLILHNIGVKMNPDNYYFQSVKEHIQRVVANKHILNKRSTRW